MEQTSHEGINIVSFHLCASSRSETGRTVLAKGLDGHGQGGECLMGAETQFGRRTSLPLGMEGSDG